MDRESIEKTREIDIHQKSSFEFIPFRGRKKRWYLVLPSRFLTAPTFRITSNNLCTSRLSNLALGGTGLEQDNVAVFDNVVLALGHDLALGLDLRLGAELLEHGVVVHDDLDEGLLEITVDDTSSRGCLGSVADGPLTHLIGAGCEERAKAEGLAHGDDDLGQGRAGTDLLALLGDLSFILEAGKTLLEGNRDGKDGFTGAVLLDPRSDLGEVLVLLPDVVTLTQVDEVDDGLGSEEEHGVDGLDLCDSKSAIESTMYVTNKARLCCNSQSQKISHDTSALK
jgi:hypothetical protein